MRSRREASAAPDPGTRTRQAEPGGRGQDAVLELQRTLGNAAVTRLVQRRDRPASTDAPGAHHGGGHHAAPPKKPAADIHARVLRYDIDQGTGRVLMSAGTDQGVQVGMPGSLLEENGSEYVDFTVESVRGAACEAHVHATQDQVNRGSNAIIKASKFQPPESQEGKEF